MSDNWRMFGRGWFSGVPINVYGEINRDRHHEVMDAVWSAKQDARVGAFAVALWTACVASAHLFKWYPSNPTILAQMIAPEPGDLSIPADHEPLVPHALDLLCSVGLIEAYDERGVPAFRLLHEGELWRRTPEEGDGG